MSTYIDTRTLKENGFVALEYPAKLRSGVGEAIRSWKGFCALSESVKKGLPYSNGGAGVGYELKDGSGKSGDQKENFDITTSGRVWMSNNIDSLTGTGSVIPKFVQRATSLVSLIRPVILDFARQAEEAFGLDCFAKEVAESEDTFFVRFIHYFGDRAVGDETATAHVDQSGFTLHLFESAPGLQCLTYDGSWIDMPVSSGETVVIPAMQMQLRSKGDLLALCHRVVATDETASVGRYSAVCFVQLGSTPKYNKDIHGRLQEKPPGFNYEMRHDAFSLLFK